MKTNQPKYQFIVEIPFAPGPREAWTQVRNIAREGRLAEFVVAVQQVTPPPVPAGGAVAPWRTALRPRRKA
jgi:hypothetical protein